MGVLESPLGMAVKSLIKLLEQRHYIVGGQHAHRFCNDLLVLVLQDVLVKNRQKIKINTTNRKVF